MFEDGEGAETGTGVEDSLGDERREHLRVGQGGWVGEGEDVIYAGGQVGELGR